MNQLPDDSFDIENIEIIGMNGSLSNCSWESLAILRDKKSGDCFLERRDSRYSLSELRGYEREGRLRLLENPLPYFPGGHFLCVHPELIEKLRLKLEPFPLFKVPEFGNYYVRYLKKERVDQLRNKWLEDNLSRARALLISDWDQAFEIIRNCAKISGGSRFEEFIAHYVAVNLVGIQLRKISDRQLGYVIGRLFRFFLRDFAAKRRVAVRGRHLAEFHLSD